MGNEVVHPVDEASAKAVEQTAILGQKVTDLTAAGGQWLAGVLGRLPHNLVGIADDRVAYYRARRWIEMNEDLERDLSTHGVKERIEPSFTVLMPLLEAAIDENRIELKNIWRRLLANAYDPVPLAFEHRLLKSRSVSTPTMRSFYKKWARRQAR
jgi:hypothetical protein